MLKAILDETSYGCYDFMYLRIGKFLQSRLVVANSCHRFRQ